MTDTPAGESRGAPDRGAPAPCPPPPPDLPGPPDAIWDGAAVTAALELALSVPRDEIARRRAVVEVLAPAQARGRAAIAATLAAHPRASGPVIHAQAWLTDCLLCATLDAVRRHFAPLANPTGAERLAVIAVGGFGRGEMAAFSDVDLLFLTSWRLTPWAESLVESVLYVLWDLRLKVGHATRDLDDCLRHAQDDMTIRTSLLEMRHIAGDAALSATLHERLRRDLFATSAAAFVEAKLAERDERHRRQGGQRYVVEPNVKEGKGGLRDLQSLFWIVKYVYGVDSARDLVERGVLSFEEWQTFAAAGEFLWAVRCHLHLIAGRAADQLGFDMQIEVARRMGYEDGGGRRGVERFMHDYFRHATRVGELTRIVLTQLEEEHTKRAPLLMRLMPRRRRARPPYAIRRNRLCIADEAAFFADPLAMIGVFGEGMRTGTLLHPDAMRLVAANLARIDDTLRASPEANRLFLDMLLRHGNPERVLRNMNELGVLGAFIPEFGAIVAMMQFNMYHHYTVDEHTIQAISHLARIERGELVEDLPLSSQILARGVNRRVLYLALLLHDCGKGRPEDHSVIGAQIARRLAPRFGLSRREAETVEWLVRHHLLMSDTAQKRDIADPRTVRDFVKAVGTQERLDLLTVLTVCDISGVGPGTWNNWKAMLMRALWQSASEAIAGRPGDSRELRETEARRALREALADWSAAELRLETQRHHGPYWQGLPTAAHLVFARLLRGIAPDSIRLDISPDPARDATRACIVMADRPGLFARMTGALAMVGANIVDARTYTSRDGWATAIFWVQDGEGHPYEEARLSRLEGRIRAVLEGRATAAEALVPRDRLKKREQAFRVPTSITFDNEGSDIYTIIEVDTRDRPALLHDLTRTMSESNVSIASAVIATYGEQAVDTFYVKDRFGLKIQPGNRQTRLEARLRAAIEAGAARARA
ncbi:MAG: [protein-PII] uridylyltransferase [Rubellimicrobium sp.]|nr:[protein-PII] uridylyltransferase [Rubellimicrobium sp.]